MQVAEGLVDVVERVVEVEDEDGEEVDVDELEVAEVEEGLVVLQPTRHATSYT